MGKLVLTSGGYLDGQRGKECDKIIESLTKNKRVLLVDNATLTGSNIKGVPIILENFKKITKLIEQTTLNESNLNLIDNFDTLYITGGDPLPFIQLIQKCDLAKAFTNYLKNGGNIIGESVGSMIFGKDLKWLYNVKKGTKPKYDIVLPNFNGLGVIDINFFPHWNKASDEMKEKVSCYEQQHNINITRVCDNEYLEFDI